VDQPDAAVDEYVTNLRAVLHEKSQAIKALLEKMDSFEAKLQQQKRLAAAGL
jgi:hypothetical protein